MPNTQRIELTAPQHAVLFAISGFGARLEKIVPAARHALWDALETESKYLSAFETLYELEQVIEETRDTFQDAVRTFVTAAGITLGNGDMRLELAGDKTFVLIDDAATDELAEVAELEFLAKLRHPKFPQFADLAKQEYIQAIDDFVVQNPDSVAPEEILATKQAITELAEAAVGAN